MKSKKTIVSLSPDEVLYLHKKYKNQGPYNGFVARYYWVILLGMFGFSAYLLYEHPITLTVIGVMLAIYYVAFKYIIKKGPRSYREIREDLDNGQKEIFEGIVEKKYISASDETRMISVSGEAFRLTYLRDTWNELKETDKVKLEVLPKSRVLIAINKSI